MFLLLACLIFVLNFCAAQECITGCEAGLSTCANIDYLIHVPQNRSQVATNESIASYLIGGTSAAPWLSTECKNVLNLAICHTHHPACSSSGPPSAILPCAQTCFDLHAVCKPFLELVTPALRGLLECNDTSIYSSNSSNCSTLTNRTPLCAAEVKPPFYGACQPFNSSLAPYYGGVCSPFVAKKIFVPVDSPNGITLLDQWAHASDNNSLNTILLAPLTPADCAEYLLSTICTLYFPTCVEVDLPAENATAFVGMQTCKSFCNYAVSDVCGKFLKELGITPAVAPLCDKFSGTYIFTVNISANIQVTLPCRSDTSRVFPLDPYTNVTILNYSCPVGTGKKLKPTKNEPLCGPKCPDVTYSEEEWNRAVIVTRIGASISVTCMVFLVALYLLNKERRQFPFTLHLNQFITTFFFSASFFIGGLHPQQTVWCDDAGTYATQHSNYKCAIQGFAFMLFGIGDTAWCAVNAYVVYFVVVVQGYNRDALTVLSKKYYQLYLFGWGVPLIFASAAVIFGRIGYGPPMALCFMNFTEQSHTISTDWYLFYIPHALNMSLAAYCFVRTLIAIFKLRNTQNVAAFKALLQAQTRCFIFITVVFVLGFSIFEWRLQIQGDDISSQEGLKWVYCKIATQLVKGYKGNCSGDNNPSRISYPHTVLEIALLSGFGGLIFPAFGLDPNLLAFLKTLSAHVYNGKWKRLSKLIHSGENTNTKNAKTRTPRP